MKIDWTKPLEMEDGTPVVLNGNGSGKYREVRLEFPGRDKHDAFKVPGYSIRVILEDGTLKYSPMHQVRNRAVTLDWSKPLEMEDGTPVVREDVSHVYSVKLEDPKRTHPAFTNIRASRIARKDGTLKYASGTVRNRPMQINTNKPLALKDDTRKVTFVTETSDNNILVGINGALASWFIFDKQGRFVRSSNGDGGALTLINTPTVQTFTTRDLYLGRDTLPVMLEVVAVEGVVTSVSLVK
jgi:hypothetical protein